MTGAPKSLRAILAGAGLVAASASALAGDGRTPIAAPAVWPFVIGTKGVHYLTQDLVVPSGSTGIDINANDVTLDLNGHTISTAGSGSLVVATDVGNVRITNGQLSGGAYGIDYSCSPASTTCAVQVDHLFLKNQTVGAIAITATTSSGTAVVEDNDITGSTASGYGSGIRLQNIWNGRVERNFVDHADDYGIYLTGCRHMIVAHNSAVSNGDLTTGGAGIYLTASYHTEVSHNLSTENVDYGIYVSGNGNTIAHNNCSASQSNGAGIQVSGEGNDVNHNTACGQYIGIYLNGADEGSVERNTVNDNSYGIELYLSDRNAVDWNVAARNSVCPIQLNDSDDNVLTFNRTPRSAACGTNGISIDGASTGSTTSGNLPTTP